MRELGQGEPDLGAADAEGGGQLFFHQLGARRQAVFPDRAQDAVPDLLDRGAAAGWLGLVRHALAH
ncbi:hypothetical protein D3C84_997340 [compost metagenome]